MVTRQEREANARFSQRYGGQRGDVVRAIELAVIGGDWEIAGSVNVDSRDLLGRDSGTGSACIAPMQGPWARFRRDN